MDTLYILPIPHAGMITKSGWSELLVLLFFPVKISLIAPHATTAMLQLRPSDTPRHQ